MDALQDGVERQLCVRAHPGNALSMFSIADTLDLSELQESARRAARRNLTAVVNDADSEQLKTVSLSRILSLVADSTLAVQAVQVPDSSVQSLISRWAEANLLGDDDARGVVLAASCAHGDRTTIVDGRLYLLRHDHGASETAWNESAVEEATDASYAAGLALRAFDTTTCMWQPSGGWQPSSETAAALSSADKLSRAASVPAVVSLDGVLYAVSAGRRAFGKLDFFYDPTSAFFAAVRAFIPSRAPPWAGEASLPGMWHAAPPLPHGRAGAVVASLGGKLIVAGGRDAPYNTTAATLTRTDVFDPAKGEWVEGPPMIDARYAAACAVLGDALYVIGGKDRAGATLRSVEMYTADGGWRAAPALQTPRRDATAFVLGGALHVAHGSSDARCTMGLRTIEKLLPATGEWTTLPFDATAAGAASGMASGGVAAGSGATSANGSASGSAVAAHEAAAVETSAAALAIAEADRGCNYLRGTDGTCFDVAHAPLDGEMAMRLTRREELFVAPAGGAGEGLFSRVPLDAGRLIELTGRLVQRRAARPRPLDDAFGVPLLNRRRVRP